MERFPGSLKVGAVAALTALSLVSLAPASTAMDTPPNPNPALSDQKSEAEAEVLPSPFYEAPATLPAGNGTLVKSEPSNFYLGPAKLVKLGGISKRIMYTSVNSKGERVGVTGSVLTSRVSWSGKGPRPLIALAAGTQGTANKCAPSVQGEAGTEYESISASAFLLAGYNVVMTDYIGLGTRGAHTYMNREDQAKAVLDSARAASQLGIPGITPTTPVGLAGYSQGGGASAAAAELAPTYAPELPIKGAYAGAVPADLKDVARKIDGGTYNAFLMFALKGVSDAYDIRLDSLLNAKGFEVLNKIQPNCTTQALPGAAGVKTNTLTVSGDSFTQTSLKEPYSSVLDRQKIGAGLKPNVPVLLTHSALDDVIPFQTGKELARRWCSQGTPVKWVPSVAPGHAAGMPVSLPSALLFFKEQFSGVKSINSCATL